MADCKRGARSSALPKRAAHAVMIALTKAITGEEIQIAATYFCRTETACKYSRSGDWKYWADQCRKLDAGRDQVGAKEAIDQRIIELPEAPKHVERRDSPRSLSSSCPLED